MVVVVIILVIFEIEVNEKVDIVGFREEVAFLYSSYRYNYNGPIVGLDK